VTKETFIKTYTDLEVKTAVRKEKNKKLDQLFQLLKDTKTDFTAVEIIDIAKELLTNDVIIRQPLFQNLLYPFLAQQVERDNIEAIKLLVRLEQHLISFQGHTKDYKYSSPFLLDKGIKIAPEDKELLKLYESKTRQYILHTLHEIPTGVLYGRDGASIEQCDELLSMTEEYERNCFKLRIDRSELINKCRLYYTSYKEYLKASGNYRSFEDYLANLKK
jgi:hypothetical protein